MGAYAAYAKAHQLPGLLAVDVAVAEPDQRAALATISSAGPLPYPVATDPSGRVADAYQVQDLPWYALTNDGGHVVWTHDGWMDPVALEKAITNQRGVPKASISPG